jgi:hypothetical protein
MVNAPRLTKARILLSTVCMAVLAVAMTGCPSDDGTRLIIENRSGKLIVEVNVSSCSDAQWGADRLGSATIPNGTDASICCFGDGCVDLRAIASDTSEALDLGVRFTGRTYVWTIVD